MLPSQCCSVAYLPQNSTSVGSEWRIWSRSRLSRRRLVWLKACVAPVWDLIAPARWELAALRDKHTNSETHFRNYKQRCIFQVLTMPSSGGKDQVSLFSSIIYIYFFFQHAIKMSQLVFYTGKDLLQWKGFRFSSPSLTVIMLKIWQQRCLGCIPESPNMFQTVQCQLLIL